MSDVHRSCIPAIHNASRGYTWLTLGWDPWVQHSRWQFWHEGWCHHWVIHCHWPIHHWVIHCCWPICHWVVHHSWVILPCRPIHHRVSHCWLLHTWACSTLINSWHLRSLNAFLWWPEWCALPFFDTANIPAEESINESLSLNATSHEAPTIEYTIVPNATKFGFPMLTDNRAYSYTNKQNSGTAPGITNWRCTKSNPHNANWHATVHQEGNTFSFNGVDHTCTAEPGITYTLCIKKKIKSAAVSNIFISAAEIR